MILLLAGSLALGSPSFVARNPSDARLAAAAWEGASQCTGWDAASHARVTVERGFVVGAYLGRAFWDHEGLYRIELDDAARDEVLVHEVAHAWVTGGPPALAEGRAELLADGSVRAKPGTVPLQWDDGRYLALMPDLKQWVNWEHAPMVMGSVRTDAYLGGARLVRTAAMLIGPRQLWPQKGTMSWDDFELLMKDNSEHGERVLAILSEGAEAQRQALSDADQDGLTLLAEEILGSNPNQWDSDRDGWWDGAPVAPANAVPLPIDGTPVCTGFATPKAGGQVRLLVGGNLRGVSLPRAVMWAGRDYSGQSSVMVMRQRSLLVALRGDVHAVLGGLWATVGGESLIPDNGCTSTSQLTVWAYEDAHSKKVADFVPALHQAMVRADAKLGLTPGRLAVALGSSNTEFRDGIVWLDSARLAEAKDRGWDELACLAVALHRVAQTNEGATDWDLVLALARSLDDVD